MSFFACCQGLPHENKKQIKTVHLETKDIIAYEKEKRVNCLNSPKASLKCLTSLKNLRSKQNLGQSKQMFLMSTVDLTNQEIHNQEKLITRRLTHENLQQGTNHLDSHLEVPFSYRQTFPNASAPKEKIRLSFRNSKNPEQKVEIPLQINKTVEQKPLLPIDKIQRKTKVQKTAPRSTISKTLNQNQEPIKKSFSFNNKHDSKAKFTLPSISSKNNKLGGSKYTIFSQEDQQTSQKQQKIQESIIILNVFHASQSKIQKWSNQKQQNNK